MKKTQTVGILETKIQECTLDLQRQRSPREYRDRREISSIEDTIEEMGTSAKKMLNLILCAEINKIVKEENKESMKNGLGPLSILLDKTNNHLLKDREYEIY